MQLQTPAWCEGRLRESPVTVAEAQKHGYCTVALLDHVGPRSDEALGETLSE